MDKDLLGGMIQNSFKRREFMLATIAAGFAIAVQPISAQTITTDTNGLTAGAISIPVTDGSIPAYRAMPNAEGSFPVVLVVHEIFGVHEHIQDICRRLAKLGYLAIAPELFARQGDASKIKNTQDIIAQIASRVPDAQVLSDLDAAATWASRFSKGNPDELAITGFCWGGRIVWLYAAHNPALKAAVAWYGKLTGQATALQPQYPIDVVKSLKAPVLGLYGGKDENIPLSTVDQMKQALAAAHSPSQIVVYPDAPHGFNADYRPSYRKEAADDGWKRLQAWFKQYGVG